MSLSEMAAAERCPVCRSRGNTPVYSEARDPITLDCFSVVECRACRLAYTAPRPDSMDRYYPPRYRAYGPLVSRTLRVFYSLRVSRWIRHGPRGGSVLEVGCGRGMMLAAFRRHGWRAVGIERSQSSHETGGRVPGVEIVTTPVEGLPEGACFDLIVLFQALEHIDKPVTLLRECARRLKPGGRILANVPNFSSWQSRFAGPKWLHLDLPRHVVHYTPETLAMVLERSGLRLAALSYASFEHDPYGWAESTISRMTGRVNILTRFLMGLDPFGGRQLLAFVLGAVLTVPALLLSVASWMVKKGALMEGIAVLAAPSEK